MVSTEMRTLIERIRTSVPPPVVGVAGHRARVSAAEALVPTPPGAVVSTVRIGELTTELVHTDSGRPRPTVLFFHHGAYIAGSPAGSRPFAADVARAAGVAFLVPDYRLAPEHPFPAAVQDGVAAYRWLLDGGLGPDEIAIGGASAGGGLAAAVLLAVAEHGLPRPATGVLICPWLDLTLSSPANLATDSPDPFPSQAISALAAQLYLAGRDPATPLASPLFADLAGLPPIHLEAAAADRLVDDATAFACRAMAAGVELTSVITEGAMHNFPQYGPDTPEGRAALDRIVAHLRSHLNASTSTGSQP